MDERAESAPGPLPAGRRRHELIAEVRARLERLERAATVVVAHSGGPDSTALLFLVAESRPDLQVVPVHVRHGLRDDSADVIAVRAAAAWLGLLSVTRDVEVGDDGGPEAAARSARWAVVRSVARDLAADAVLVGHTADDQAETVLLQAARGAGLRGISAMSTWREDESGVPVGRPLLHIRRSDVHAFVAGEGLPTAADPSNDDTDLRRNLVRQVVMPALDRVAGDAVASLARLADLARLDEATLAHLTEQALAERAMRWGPGWALDSDVLAHLPGVARRAVLSLLAEAGATTVDAALVSSILELESGRERHAAGMRASRDRRWLAVVPAGVAPPAPARLPVPGELEWGAVVLVVADQPVTPDGSEEQAALDLGQLERPPLPDQVLSTPPGGHDDRTTILLPADLPAVTVRPRRSGDRVHTAAGTRTVAAVMADSGVPRVMRDHVPLLEVGGRIVWIAGVDADVELVARGRSGACIRVSMCLPGSRRATAPDAGEHTDADAASDGSQGK